MSAENMVKDLVLAKNDKEVVCMTRGEEASLILAVVNESYVHKLLANPSQDGATQPFDVTTDSSNAQPNPYDNIPKLPAGWGKKQPQVPKPAISGGNVIIVNDSDVPRTNSVVVGAFGASLKVLSNATQMKTINPADALVSGIASASQFGSYSKAKVEPNNGGKGKKGNKSKGADQNQSSKRPQTDVKGKGDNDFVPVIGGELSFTKQKPNQRKAEQGRNIQKVENRKSSEVVFKTKSPLDGSLGFALSMFGLQQRVHLDPHNKHFKKIDYNKAKYIFLIEKDEFDNAMRLVSDDGSTEIDTDDKIMWVVSQVVCAYYDPRYDDNHVKAILRGQDLSTLMLTHKCAMECNTAIVIRKLKTMSVYSNNNNSVTFPKYGSGPVMPLDMLSSGDFNETVKSVRTLGDVTLHTTLYYGTLKPTYQDMFTSVTVLAHMRDVVWVTQSTASPSFLRADMYIFIVRSYTKGGVAIESLTIGGNDTEEEPINVPVRALTSLLVLDHILVESHSILEANSIEGVRLVIPLRDQDKLYSGSPAAYGIGGCTTGLQQNGVAPHPTETIFNTCIQLVVKKSISTQDVLSWYDESFIVRVRNILAFMKRRR